MPPLDRLVRPCFLRQERVVRFGPGLRLVGRPWVVRHPSAEIVFGRTIALLLRPSQQLFLSATALCNSRPRSARISIGDETAISGVVIVSEVSIED